MVFEYTTAPFQILARNIDFEAKTVTLTWNSLPGKSYAIQKSTNLQNWDDLDFIHTEIPQPAPITAGPDEWSMTHTASDPSMNTPEQPKAYYRVRAQP